MGCFISAVVLYLMQTYAKSLRKGAFICRYIALSKVRFIINTLEFIKKARATNEYNLLHALKFVVSTCYCWGVNR